MEKGSENAVDAAPIEALYDVMDFIYVADVFMRLEKILVFIAMIKR